MSSMGIGAFTSSPVALRILGKQCFGVAFNGLIGNVRHSKGHFGRSSSASVERKHAVTDHYFSFAFCAGRASRARSSAVRPFAARRKSAISRGRWRMMSVKSDEPAPPGPAVHQRRGR